MKKISILYWLIGMFIVVLPLAGGAVELSQIDSHGFVGQGYLKSSDSKYLVDFAEGSLGFEGVGINFSTQMGKLRMRTQIMCPKELIKTADKYHNDISSGCNAVEC